MQKVALIILISFFSVWDLFPQVTIKEKVELDFSNSTPMQLTETASVVTPLYGNVTLAIQCQYLVTNLQITFIVGGSSVDVNCGGIECNNYVGCWPCGIGQILARTIENQLAGSTIDVTARLCRKIGSDPNKQWVDLPTQVGAMGENYVASFGINVGFPETEDWRYGTITFSPTTPSDCIPGKSCSDENIFIPDVMLVKKERSFLIENYDPCLKSGVRGFFEATKIKNNLKTNLLNFNKDSLEICFNKNKQTWQISSINPIHINYVIDFCTNPNDNLILNKEHLISILNSNPVENCERALKSIFGHYSYPIKNPFPWPGFGFYLFKEVLEAHENRHKLDYEEYKNKFLPDFKQNIEYYINLPCEGTDLDEIKTQALNKFNLAFNEYWFKFDHEYNKDYGLYIGGGYKEAKERETHKKKEVVDVINDYKDLIFSHCFGL